MSDHRDRRGRRHSRYDDKHHDDRRHNDRYADDRYPDDRYYDDGYYSDSSDYYEPRPKPRHRSVSRRALDRISSAMGKLGLDKDSKDASKDSRNHQSSRSQRHRSRSRSRDRDRSRDRSRSRDRPRDYYPPSSSRSHNNHRDRDRRRHSTSPSRGRSHRDSTNHRDSSRSRSRLERGVKAGIDAAAVEAFRLRREPGAWVGAKGGRVATAAISAGVIGAAAEKRKDEKGGGKMGSMSSALGGLVVNRMLNGSRKEVR